MTGRLDSSTAQTSCKSAAEGCTPTSCEGGGEGPSVQGNSPLMVNERDSGRGRWVQSERREAGYGGARGRACSVGPGHASTCSWPGVQRRARPRVHLLMTGRAASGPATRPPAHGRACAAQVDPPTLRAWVQVRRIWRRLRTLSCLCLCALTVSTSMCTVCVH
jgi:hypothetical protein